jgi:transposase
MTPEETFAQLLGLGKSWRVVRTEFEVKESTFVICVEETPELWPEESQRAGIAVSCYDHVEAMQWRHLNVFSKECVIVCALPRARRSDDGKVYRVTPPWEGRSKHFTREFEAFALTLIREMPVKRAGEILGETDQRMWRMLFAHVDAAYAQLSLEDVVWVGADEMNRRKGHNYLTVFADLIEKRVIFATPGKDASTWETFAAELVKHNGHPKAISQVAIDMSAAYTKGVRENLGNAQIVYDKFHVVQSVVGACDDVRKAESRLNPEHQQRLERTRWLWRKNPENWTRKEAQRWEAMAKERGVTGLAYEMRLVLQEIYRCACVREARQKFEDWCAWVHAMREEVGEILKPMVSAAGMVERHLNGILAHWKQGLTTAFLEGLNSLFSAVKRRARGYRSTEHMITMLYFVAGKLRVPCH